MNLAALRFLFIFANPLRGLSHAKNIFYLLHLEQGSRAYSSHMEDLAQTERESHKGSKKNDFACS